MLILFAANCFGSAPQDSIKTRPLQLQELKAVASLLNEVEYRREKDQLNDQKIERLNSIVEKQNGIIGNEKEIIKNLNDQIEQTKPAFYDNFIFGASAASIAFVVLILLTK